MTLVKICGLGEVSHAMVALEAGADMLGFVFAASRRAVHPDRASRIIAACRETLPGREWRAIGVFANQPIGFVEEVARLCRLDVVQLSGNEPPSYTRQFTGPVFKAIHMGTWPAEVLGHFGAQQATQLTRLAQHFGAERVILDSGGNGIWGGTGRTFDWNGVGNKAGQSIIAGGLTPANVAEAIGVLRPWAVDVSSGVEVDGRKDPWLIRRFIAEVRRCDHDAGQGSG